MAYSEISPKYNHIFSKKMGKAQIKLVDSQNNQKGINSGHDV